MTKTEDYASRSAASLTAASAATTDRDRQFHLRAHGIYKKLARNVGEAEVRAAAATPKAGRTKTQL